jgi:hypothetical protein
MANPKTVDEIKAYIKANKLPLSDAYIKSVQAFEKSEFDNILSYDEAYELSKEYESQGCLMYTDCAECSRAHNKFCPLSALDSALRALKQA